MSTKTILPEPAALAARLNIYRLANDLTYDEVGALCGVSGCTIHRIIHKQNYRPNARTRHKILALMGVSGPK